MEQIIGIVVFVLLSAALLFYGTHRKRWQLWRIVQTNDPEQIEAARDQVTPRVIPYLIKQYWRAKEWERKRAIVELLQDQTDPDLRQLMLDYLRAPLSPGDEQTQLAQAIALGFVDERYDRFMAYYNDHDLLTRDVRSVLQAHGLRAEPPIEPPPSPPQPRPQADASAAVSPNQRLANGIGAGDRAVVEGALGDGADLNIIALRSWTPLVIAVSGGLVRMTRLLIRAGADVHYRVPAGERWDGKKLPERGMLDFVRTKGKRGESIQALLKEKSL